MELISSAVCVHNSRNPCRRPASVLFVAVVGDYGTGPSIAFTGACPRHSHAVRRQVEKDLWEVSRFGVADLRPEEVGQTAEWIHERSGLCATHHISVTQPSTPT